MFIRESASLGNVFVNSFILNEDLIFNNAFAFLCVILISKHLKLYIGFYILYRNITVQITVLGLP